MSSAFAQTTSTVTAMWDANTDTATRGYLVSYGTAPGSYQWTYDAGAQTSAPLTLNRGSQYYFVVRAYDALADFSTPSNEATIDLRDVAPTATLTATLQNNTSALVTWSTTNATAVTINGTAVAASGSTTVAVSGTTTFTLVASGPGGSVTQTATVTPTQPAPTASLTATLQNNTSALVTWSTANATSVTINGVAVAASGSTTVAVSGATTFTLVATGAGGSVTRTASVSPVAAPTASLTATLQNNTTALVSWSTSNATSVTINGAAVAASGSTTVAVSAATTFTLVATGAGGSVTRTATVTPTVTPAPTATLTATMTAATTATVTWGTTNATSVTINGAAVAASGSTTVAVSAATTFTLVATGAGGSVTRTASVSPTSTILNAPTTLVGIASGSHVTLSWRAATSGMAPDRYLLYLATKSYGANIINGLSVGNVLSVSGDLPRGHYYARVKAAAGATESPFSNQASFWVGKGVSSPSGFNVTWNGAVATFSWTQPAADAASEDEPVDYVLEAGTAPGLTDIAQVHLGNVRSFTAPVPPGTYYVRVRAANAFGESDPTDDVLLTPPGTPEAPTQLVATGSANSLTLRWRAPGSGVTPTGYQIEAGTASGLSDLGVMRVGTLTSFSTVVPRGGTYYIRVRALAGDTVGAASDELVVRR